jgi:hypothetical protein
MVRQMSRLIAARTGVVDVPHLFAVVIRPSSLIIDGDVTFADDPDVPAAEHAIMRCVAALTERWPPIEYAYLTPAPTARPRRAARSGARPVGGKKPRPPHGRAPGQAPRADSPSSWYRSLACPRTVGGRALDAERRTRAQRSRPASSPLAPNWMIWANSAARPVNDRPARNRQVRPGVHINAVREVGNARPESAGSRMAMQGGV